MSRRGVGAALAAATLALAWGAAGCKGGGGEPATAEVAARGQAALKPLKQGLMKALTEALASGGPEVAIAVCREQAPVIAAAASQGGVVVGRTSDRLRNPANAPRAWVAPLLAEYAAAGADARPAQRVVPLPDGRFGYVEPIVVAEACTACHGQHIDPAVGAKLAASYPHDRATGYAEGDLRGLFWAELPASAAP